MGWIFVRLVRSYTYMFLWTSVNIYYIDIPGREKRGSRRATATIVITFLEIQHDVSFSSSKCDVVNRRIISIFFFMNKSLDFWRIYTVTNDVSEYLTVLIYPPFFRWTFFYPFTRRLHSLDNIFAYTHTHGQQQNNINVFKYHSYINDEHEKR